MQGDYEVTLFSFGFKHGVPEDVNMVWDVRFLPNPYWEEQMRHLNGLNSDVAEYVIQSKSGIEFLELLHPLLTFLVKQNRAAGKDMMRIAIGCTGGKHRSVAVVEKLAECMEKAQLTMNHFHRDIEKE